MARRCRCKPGRVGAGAARSRPFQWGDAWALAGDRLVAPRHQGRTEGKGADPRLALAVSDQRSSGADCLRRHAVSLASEEYEFRRRQTRWLVTVSNGGRARMPRDRSQAVAARWMVLLHLHKLVFS